MTNVKKVKCEICDQIISKSNYSKHLKRHTDNPESFNKKKYTLDYNGVLTCQFCGRKCKNKNSLSNHERLCKLNPDRRIIRRDNFNNFGRAAWNKGLTKETDVRVAKGSDTFRKNDDNGLHKKLTGGLNPSKRPEVRKKISNTCLIKSARGQWHKSLAKKMHREYNGVDLDGSWELKYAQYLDLHNIRWRRCTNRFLYLFKNKWHYYTPDFYLIDTDTYVEIKGYAVDKDFAKWSYFPKDKTLLVLQCDDLKSMNVL